MTTSNDTRKAAIILGVLTLGPFMGGCGGSSSETPPPLPPSHRTDRVARPAVIESVEQRRGRAAEQGDAVPADEAAGESVKPGRPTPPAAAGDAAGTPGPAESTWGGGE